MFSFSLCIFTLAIFVKDDKEHFVAYIARGLNIGVTWYHQAIYMRNMKINPRYEWGSGQRLCGPDVGRKIHILLFIFYLFTFFLYENQEGLVLISL